MGLGQYLSDGRSPWSFPAKPILPVRTTPAATAAARTIGFGPGLVDGEGSPANVCTVDTGNSLSGLIVIRHFNKAEALGLARVPVRHKVHTIDSPIGFKQRTDALLGRAETQIADIDVKHVYLTVARIRALALPWRPVRRRELKVSRGSSRVVYSNRHPTKSRAASCFPAR